jgi:F0F1-type ATP synthase membrane subunit b/b'
MDNQITTMQEVTPATQKAYDTHARILANGQVMARALVDVCHDLKTMRDEGLYTELGYDTFEEYAEQACGIKQRQAYSYISAYEKLGQKYMADHADLGITKLELISQISSYEREEFLEDVDAESATVRELKAEVERYKKQTEQLTFDLGQAQSELSEAPEPVDTDALRSSIEQEVKAKYSAQLEELQQRADAAPDPEVIRKEAEKEAAKEYKAKLATAKADAEKKAKAAVEKLEQEKADLERQLDSSTTKLDAAVRQAKAAGADTDVAACRVYFTELQQTAAKVQELIGKVAGVMELVDVVDSKSTASDGVPVRVRPPAPNSPPPLFPFCSQLQRIWRWQAPNAETAVSEAQGGEQDVYSSTNHSCGRGCHCCIFRRDRLWSEL